ncbi:MAG TPA: 50S ribosomal protein L3 N(5)-glutamine methyltransferase [Aestuariivirgaceae bacterium]|nr:50S ribosomal protein L3 N(5)-glutamine methyltransferase [Aestuariivirgaceae bacterium]
MSDEALSELRTVRDLLRYAVSRFNAAHLAYGQGATTAVDEACFLILETLHLPIDDINPFADAVLLPSERRLLLARIEERVATRRPAAYITGRAYIQGVPFHVDERVIVPRSYLGEMLATGRVDELAESLPEVSRILDLCTGSGCLAVLAARAFPHAEVDAVDRSKDALAVARRNVEDAGMADRIRLVEGDLFAPLAGRRYDLILSNPPYVSAAAMAELPPEFRHEPAMALAGGDDGLDLVRRILAEAPHHLGEAAALLCEIGTGRDVLERDFPDLDFLWLDSAESEGEVFWLEAASFGRAARRTARR